MTPTKEQVVSAYKYFTQTEARYTDNPDELLNLAVCRAQRTYYRRLSHYNRAHYPPHEARTKRAAAIKLRAQQNRYRLLHDQRWQALTTYQCARAALVLRRAQALSDYEAPTPAPKPPRATRKPLRVRHPITQRYMYYDPPTDTYSHDPFPTQQPVD